MALICLKKAAFGRFFVVFRRDLFTAFRGPHFGANFTRTGPGNLKFSEPLCDKVACEIVFGIAGGKL